MIKALKFCSWAVAKKNFEPALVHFKIGGGRIQSYNGRISMSSPIELTLECQPLATQFLKTIASCKDSIHMTLTAAGKLSVKSGNIRALIPCSQEEFPEIAPTGREIALNGGLLAALGKLEPLIAEDASRAWARGILFRGDHAYATNNVVIGDCVLGQKFDQEFNLPHAAVNELIRIKDEPVSMRLSETSASFIYDDGRWLRTALLETQWPDIARILDAEHQPFIDLPESFWASLDDLRIHVDEFRRIFIKPNFLTTSLDPTEASYAEVTGMPDGGCYDIEMLRALKGLAMAIDFTSYPGPALWTGEGIRGAIIGRKF